jgi:spore coat polysaccharide biosynthesis protein SpsF
MPALQHLLERLKQARSLDRIVLCTTREAEDDPLAALAEQAAVPCHRGPTEDVLARMLGALDGHAVDAVARVTADDILVDPDYVDRAVCHHLEVNAEYSDLKALPSGTEVEVFDVDVLRDLQRLARNAGGTEYLTWYVTDHLDQFSTASVPVDERHARPWRLTLDTPEDYRVIRTVLAAMRERGKALDYRLDDIVDYLSGHPELLRINAAVRHQARDPSVSTALAWDRLP